MAKLSIMELIAMKDWVTRRSTLARGGVVLTAAALLYSFGSDGLSYITTAGRLVKDHVKVSVPVEFELERARTMVSGLVPEVRHNLMSIAQEEVGIEHLRKDVARVEADLFQEREHLLKMRSDIENKSGSFKKGIRVATTEEVREELARRFSRYQTSEATVVAKQQLLEARERSLIASRAQVDNMLNVKKDLELQIEQLEARLKTQQNQAVTSEIAIDDSQVSKCRQLVDDLRIRLEVADRIMATNGKYSDVPVPTLTNSADIGEQIDRHFSGPAKDPEVANNN